MKNPQRPQRQQYREFFASLPAERQDAQLRGLFAWIVATQHEQVVGQGSDGATHVETKGERHE